MNRTAMRPRRRRWLPRQRPTIWPVTVGRRANVVHRPTADCQFRSRSYSPGSLPSLLLTLTCAHTYLCIDVQYVYTTCMITFLSYLLGVPGRKRQGWRMKANTRNELLTECACSEVRNGTGGVSRMYEDFLRDEGLNGTQFSLLSLIRAGKELSISTLGRAMALDRTSITRALAPLEREGLIRS